MVLASDVVVYSSTADGSHGVVAAVCSQDRMGSRADSMASGRGVYWDTGGHGGDGSGGSGKRGAV